MPKPKLKYLFRAEYKDGRIYRQNPDDASLKEPPVMDANGELQGKSCMFDIQKDVDNLSIKRFSLIGEGQKITVDLETGLFEVNGLEVTLESDKLPTIPKGGFKLIYYRQRSASLDVTYQIKTGDIQDFKPHDTIFTEYFIGWECNINGKNYKQKLAIA